MQRDTFQHPPPLQGPRIHVKVSDNSFFAKNYMHVAAL